MLSTNLFTNKPSNTQSGQDEVAETKSEVELLFNCTINRTYESPVQWYYMTFTPFKDQYAKSLDWYTFKGLDVCRKLVSKDKAYLITREIEATAIHINILVASDRNLERYHLDCYKGKYKIFVQRLSQSIDRHNVLTYVTKEALNRPFKLYLDYLIKADC